MGKTDLNAAYQYVDANTKIASTCISIVGKLAFLCLCIPFGTTIAPGEYTNINEAAIYLGKYLLAGALWDATNLQSPHRHLLPREDYIPASDPLVKVDQLVVNIEVKEASMYGFIYDIITITIYDPC